MYNGRSGDDIRAEIIKHANLAQDAAIGVASTFGKELRVDEKNGSLWVVANTADIDLEKEVVVPSGANTDMFFKLRNIYMEHRLSFEYLVGKLRSAKPRYGANGEQDAWLCHIGIAPLKKNAYAEDVMVLAREGGISVSIGFQAKDYGKPTTSEMKRYTQNNVVPRSIVRSWDWAELSVVGFPCNLKALQIGYGEPMSKRLQTVDDFYTKRYGLYDNLVTKSKIKLETAEVLGFSRKDKDKERRIETAKRRILLLDVD